MTAYACYNTTDSSLQSVHWNTQDKCCRVSGTDLQHSIIHTKMPCKIDLVTCKTARVRQADSENTCIAFFAVVSPDCSILPVRHRVGGQPQVTSGLRDLFADFVCFSAVLISALLASKLAAILLMRLRHCSMAGLRACTQQHSSTCFTMKSESALGTGLAS